MFSFLSFVGGRRRYGEIHTEEEATQVLQEALRHYEAPGLLPPDSRVDPRLPQREAGSLLSIRSMVKLTWFVATKCTVSPIVSQSSFHRRLTGRFCTQRRKFSAMSWRIKSTVLNVLHGASKYVLRPLPSSRRVSTSAHGPRPNSRVGTGHLLT